MLRYSVKLFPVPDGDVNYTVKVQLAFCASVTVPFKQVLVDGDA